MSIKLISGKCTVARGNLHKAVLVYQLCPFLNFFMITPTLVTSLWITAMNPTWHYLIQRAAVCTGLSTCRLIHIDRSMNYIGSQFFLDPIKLLIITFKILRGLVIYGTASLWQYLLIPPKQIAWAQSQSFSLKHCHLIGTGKCAFSTASTTLWNRDPTGPHPFNPQEGGEIWHFPLVLG